MIISVKYDSSFGKSISIPNQIQQYTCGVNKEREREGERRAVGFGNGSVGGASRVSTCVIVRTSIPLLAYLSGYHEDRCPSIEQRKYSFPCDVGKKCFCTGLWYGCFIVIPFLLPLLSLSLRLSPFATKKTKTKTKTSTAAAAARQATELRSRQIKKATAFFFLWEYRT